MIGGPKAMKIRDHHKSEITTKRLSLQFPTHPPCTPPRSPCPPPQRLSSELTASKGRYGELAADLEAARKEMHAEQQRWRCGGGKAGKEGLVVVTVVVVVVVAW